MLPLSNFLIYSNLVVHIAIVIWYSNNVPALTNQFTLSFVRTVLEQVVQTIQSVSKSEIHIISSTEVRISCGNLCHLIGRYTKTQSNKNRICSEFVWTVQPSFGTQAMFQL